MSSNSNSFQFDFILLREFLKSAIISMIDHYSDIIEVLSSNYQSSNSQLSKLQLRSQSLRNETLIKSSLSKYSLSQFQSNNSDILFEFLNRMIIILNRLYVICLTLNLNNEIFQRILLALSLLKIKDFNYYNIANSLNYLSNYLHKCLLPTHDILTSIHCANSNSYNLLPQCVTRPFFENSNEIENQTRNDEIKIISRLNALLSNVLLQSDLPKNFNFVQIKRGIVYLTCNHYSVGLSLRMSPRTDNQQNATDNVRNVSKHQKFEQERERITWRIFHIKCHVNAYGIESNLTNHQITILVAHINTLLHNNSHSINPVEPFQLVSNFLNQFTVQLVLQLCMSQMITIRNEGRASKIMIERGKKVELEYWEHAIKIPQRNDFCGLPSKNTTNKLIISVEKMNKLTIQHMPPLPPSDQANSKDNLFRLNIRAIDVSSLLDSCVNIACSRRLKQFYKHLRFLNQQQQIERKEPLFESIQFLAFKLDNDDQRNCHLDNENDMKFANDSRILVHLTTMHSILIRSNRHSGNFTFHVLNNLQSQSDFATAVFEQSHRLEKNFKPLISVLTYLRRIGLQHELRLTFLSFPYHLNVFDETSIFYAKRYQPLQNCLHLQFGDNQFFFWSFQITDSFEKLSLRCYFAKTASISKNQKLLRHEYIYSELFPENDSQLTNRIDKSLFSSSFCHSALRRGIHMIQTNLIGQLMNYCSFHPKFVGANCESDNVITLQFNHYIHNFNCLLTVRLSLHSANISNSNHTSNDSLSDSVSIRMELSLPIVDECVARIKQQAFNSILTAPLVHITYVNEMPTVRLFCRFENGSLKYEFYRSHSIVDQIYYLSHSQLQTFLFTNFLLNITQKFSIDQWNLMNPELKMKYIHPLYFSIIKIDYQVILFQINIPKCNNKLYLKFSNIPSNNTVSSISFENLYLLFSIELIPKNVFVTHLYFQHSFSDTHSITQLFNDLYKTSNCLYYISLLQFKFENYQILIIPKNKFCISLIFSLKQSKCSSTKFTSKFQVIFYSESQILIQYENYRYRNDNNSRNDNNHHNNNTNFVIENSEKKTKILEIQQFCQFLQQCLRQ